MNERNEKGEYLDVVQDGNRPSQEEEQEEEDSHERASGDSIGGKVLYLKDWHFQRLRKEGGVGSERGGGSDAASAAAVETPFFFDDDWLNWWYVVGGTGRTLVVPFFGFLLLSAIYLRCVWCRFFSSLDRLEIEKTSGRTHFPSARRSYLRRHENPRQRFFMPHPRG